MQIDNSTRTEGRLKGGHPECPARSAVLAILLFAVSLPACLNPFAPGRDDSPAEGACDPTTIPGAFQCFQAAYTFRDTTAYGPLLAENFVFVYRDYERGIDVTWGRDDEMRSTFGLFRNAQRLDLIWNNIVSTVQDSNSINVVRSFNLTITFNPTDVERVDGYANLTFARALTTDPWKIVRWRDESNF